MTGTSPLAGRTYSAGQSNTGAANRTRTCDPVITNDVLYQLSYCGEPSGRFGEGSKTPAPDIGRAAILQEKRGSPARELAAPARQKPAPAAALAGRRGLFGEFVAG